MPYRGGGGERSSLFEALEDCLVWIRRKFGELIEVEISQTVASPEQLKDEVFWLMETLRRGS